MLKKGYKAYSSPGRHIMGSNIFWYFNAVCGGQTEYSADMDLLDDNWKAREWEHNPGGDMWQFQAGDIIPPRYPQPQRQQRPDFYSSSFPRPFGKLRAGIQ